MVAFIVNVAATGLAIAIATFTRFYLARLNSKIERHQVTGESGSTKAQINASFRYIL